MNYLPLSRGVRYSTALASVAIAFLLGQTLDQTTGLALPLSFFSAAVLVSAVVGGFGPGLLATLLSVVCATFVFAIPTWSFRVDQVGDWLRVGVFIAEGLIISALGSALDSARRLMFRPGWQRYAVAVQIIAVATLLKLPFGALIGTNVPFLLFYAAVLACAWLGGLGPGLLGTGLAALAANIFFMEPRYTLWVDSPIQAAQLMAFVTQGALVSFFSTVGFRAWHEAARQGQLRQAAEARFSRLVDQLEEYAVFAIDTAGRITDWNSRAEQLIGYEQAAATGRSWVEFFADDPQAAVPLALLDTAAQRGSVVQTCWLVRADSSRFLAEIAVANERSTGFSVLVRDLTKQTRLQDQLRESQKLELVGRLAGGVAHDFNNLLTIILGCGELALDTLPASDHESAVYIRDMIGAAERSAGLTRQLLTFSRPQAIPPQPIDLNRVLRNLQVLLARFANNQIKIIWQLANGTLITVADPTQIEQVALNLFINARDAMPHGGTVTLQTRGPLTLPERITATGPIVAGRYIMFLVSDTGHGMSTATRSQIFEPFFSTKQTGTGLGLATVREIVQQAGGGIIVESQLGHGTTFQILLPAVSSDATELRLPMLAPLRGEGTVLIAEDDPDVRALLVIALKTIGFTILEAADGATAESISLHHTGEIRLLIANVRMPGVTGPVLAAALRLARPTLRVLFITGWPDPSTDVIPDAHLLLKPFTPEHVRRAAVETLSGG